MVAAELGLVLRLYGYGKVSRCNVPVLVKLCIVERSRRRSLPRYNVRAMQAQVRLSTGKGVHSASGITLVSQGKILQSEVWFWPFNA